MADLIKIESEESLKRGIKEAIKAMSKGGAVSFPAESFYALGVDALNPAAIRTLFRIKQRESSKPILIFVSSLGEAAKYVASMTPEAKKLAERFWPGGLTMAFEPSPVLPSVLTGDKNKIGIRVPGNSLALELSREYGHPVTGTSANISGGAPCTKAEEVLECLGRDLDLILDRGQAPGGKPSTVIDVTVTPPLVMREGMVGKEDIACCGIYHEVS